MPVKHTCSCGKVLQIKDELMGKKLKCPGCQKVFVAGGAAPPPGPAKGAAAAKPAPPAPAKPKVPAKPAAPPPAAKGAPMPKRPLAPKPPPPAEEEDFFPDRSDEPPRKPARTPPPRYEAEEEEEETDEAPLPPKGKAGRGGQKSSKLLLIILLAVLVLGGGGGAYYFFVLNPSGPTPKIGPIAQKTGDNQQPGGGPEMPDPTKQEPAKPEPEKPDPAKEIGKEMLPPPNPAAADDDLARVPGDATVFFSLSGDVWNAPLLDSLRKPLGPKIEEEFAKKTGFSLDNLERVTAFLVGTVEEVAQKPTEPPLVILVKLRKPVDKEQVTKTLLQARPEGLAGATITFLGDRLFALGKEPVVKKILERKDAPKASERLQQALDLAGKGKTLVVALAIPPQDVDNLRKLAEANPEIPPFAKPFLQIRGDILLTLDITDSLKVALTLGMTDAEAAEAAKKAGEELVAQGKEQLKEVVAKKPEVLVFQPLIEAALANLTFETSERVLEITFHADKKMAGLAAWAVPLALKFAEAGGKSKEPPKKEEKKTIPEKDDQAGKKKEETGKKKEETAKQSQPSSNAWSKARGAKLTLTISKDNQVKGLKLPTYT